MLIRSQDRKTLINHDLYTIAINRIKPHQIIAYPPTSTSDVTCIEIGKYATTDRAIEVLDELEHCYERRYVDNCYAETYGTYQMPIE